MSEAVGPCPSGDDTRGGGAAADSRRLRSRAVRRVTGAVCVVGGLASIWIVSVAGHAPASSSADAGSSPYEAAPLTAPVEFAAGALGDQPLAGDRLNERPEHGPEAQPIPPPEAQPIPAPSHYSAKPEHVLTDGAAPRWVRIDAIGVRAPITPADVQSATGELAVPEDGVTVAWFRGSSRPGQQGSAVLAAHVGWAGRPAVFQGLGDLPLGAVVVVGDDDGIDRSFVVSARRVYPKGQLPQDIYRRTGPPVVTLITCGGSFDEEAGSYSENVVIEAVPT